MLGPIGFVRRYLRKFASWALIFSMAYLTYWAISKSNLHAFWAAAGQGRLPDVRPGGRPRDRERRLVDAARRRLHALLALARGARSGAPGIGYLVPTIWCIGLGILVVLSRGIADAQSLPAGVAAAGGVALVALAAITIDESEKAFADIYSTAVSIQNLLPRVPQRLLITLVSAAATGLALALDLGNYQNFLYLLGSFFVPALRRAARRLARRRRALPRAGHLRRARVPVRADRRVGRRLLPLPVAVAGRAELVDRPRRAHASRAT